MGYLRKAVWGVAVFLLPAVLPGSDRRVEIPFKLYRGYTIVARGEIGELKKLNLLIDTGTLPSVIDQRIARKLRLSGQREELSVSGQIVQVEKTVVPEIRLGPIRAQSPGVLVSDLSFIERGLGVRIDAMVGLDILGKQSFSIDYRKRRLRFGRVRNPGRGVRFEPGFPYVVVRLHENGTPIRLLVDTGTNHLILFDQKVRPRLRELRSMGTRSLANINGAVTLHQVRLADPWLGDHPLAQRLALVLETPAHGTGDFDGLLGLTTLGAKRVDFDFERRFLSWSR